MLCGILANESFPIINLKQISVEFQRSVAMATLQHREAQTLCAETEKFSLQSPVDINFLL